MTVLNINKVRLLKISIPILLLGKLIVKKTANKD